MRRIKPPKNTDQRRIWIRAELEMRGHTYASIARELQVTRECVRMAVNSRYPKMEREIAKRLGLQPADIWPERYAA